MAKYEITHACGHTVTHNIVGRNVDGERERKAANLAKCDCTDCHRAKKTAANADATADLPALNGSEKQVSWATDIRATKRVELVDVRVMAQSFLEKDPVNAQAAIDVVDATLAQASGSYWIDNRSTVMDLRWVHGQIHKQGRT